MAGANEGMDEVSVIVGASMPVICRTSGGWNELLGVSGGDATPGGLWLAAVFRAIRTLSQPYAPSMIGFASESRKSTL